MCLCGSFEYILCIFEVVLQIFLVAVVPFCVFFSCFEGIPDSDCVMSVCLLVSRHTGSLWVCKIHVYPLQTIRTGRQKYREGRFGEESAQQLDVHPNPRSPHPLTPILQTQAPFNMADGAPRRSANALQTLRDSKNCPSAGQPDTFRASSSSLFAHDELIWESAVDWYFRGSGLICVVFQFLRWCNDIIKFCASVKS